jgi:hypothetical protein
MRMKFWRSSSSSKDDQKDLAETGRALASQAVVSLFSMREISADPWRQIAERYRSLVAGASLDPETRGAGMLAELVCSPDSETASSFAAQIPTAGECELYALVADAVIADRVARSNPGIPEPHSRLAESLYALMPKYYQTGDNYLAGSLRILSEYIAFFARRSGYRGAFAEASSLTAGTSHLASRYGIYRYSGSVVEVGEKVLHANNGAAGRDAVGYWTVANNLANLHIALAHDQPPAAARHYKEALKCAETALTALDRAVGEDIPQMRETTLQKLVQLHARLALKNVDTTYHRGEALRFSDKYISAASDRAAAAEWAAGMSAALETNRPESDSDEYGSRAAAFEVQCSLAADRFGEWAKESGRRIAEAGGAEVRAQTIAEVLDGFYCELGAELVQAISASGFDWGVCKVLLALGAVAGGRLGELTGALVRSWLTSAVAPQDKSAWTAFRARQYLSAGGESQADRAGAAGRVAGLAMLADAVEQNSPDVRFQQMIRTRNAALVKRIVEGLTLFQECAGPALSHDADLEALERAGRRIFRTRVQGAPTGRQSAPSSTS